MALAHGAPVSTCDAVEDVIDRQRRGAAVRRDHAVNDIPPDQQPDCPGNTDMERRIRNINRCNAMAPVVRRNKASSEYSGQIAYFASSAALYGIGLKHFWRSRARDTGGGDLVLFQSHAPLRVTGKGEP